MRKGRAVLAWPFSFLRVVRGLDVAEHHPAEGLANSFCAFLVSAVDAFTDAGACCCLVHGSDPLFVAMCVCVFLIPI